MAQLWAQWQGEDERKEVRTMAMKILEMGWRDTQPEGRRQHCCQSRQKPWGFHQARILIQCKIIPQPSLPTPVAPVGGEGEGGERWGKNINQKSVSGLTWIYNNPGKHLLHILGTYRKSPAPSALIICCHRLALLSGDLFDLKSLFSKMFPSGSP